jgi:hypothetical protein
MTTKVRRIDDPEDAIASLSASGPVIVNQDLILGPSETASGTRAEVTLDRPGLIEISAHSDAAELLVLSERYSDSWKITIDGTSANVVRAEVDFMACLVPAGSHSVRFSFESDSLKTGRRVSLGALMLLMACVAIRFGMDRGLLSAT